MGNGEGLVAAGAVAVPPGCGVNVVVAVADPVGALLLPHATATSANSVTLSARARIVRVLRRALSPRDGTYPDAGAVEKVPRTVCTAARNPIV